MLNKFKYILIVTFLAATSQSIAQRDTTINREVEVVKAFKPTVADAHKINQMPKIEETVPQKPNFSYNINSEPFLSSLSVLPLKAASFAPAPKEETGYGFVKAGLGNYNKPYGELFFNHLTSKKSTFGLHAMHLSSHGKLTLKGGDRVNAPFAKNQAEIYYNQFLRESVLSFNAGLNHDGFNYYGYPVDPVPALLLAEGQTLNYFGTKQAFTKGGISVKLDNPSAGINDPHFGFDFDYHYFKTKTGQNENFVSFMAHMQKPFSFATGLLDAGFTFNDTKNILNQFTQLNDSRRQSWLYLNPSVYFEKDMFNAKLGANAWYVTDKDENPKIRFSPNILLNFTPVKNIIKLYAGADGNYIDNRYSKIAYENPFVDPNHDVLNSFEKLRIFGGFDGKFAPKTNFKIGADYSFIDDQPFYYLHRYNFTLTHIYDPAVVDNDFSVLYDDVRLLKINLEIIHRSSDKLDLLLSGNYYSYKLDVQSNAWNMPAWDANLTVGYKFTEQLSASADFFLIGERKALIIHTPFNYLPPSSSVANPATLLKYKLGTVFDMNLRLDYKFTQKFGLFGQLNNFGFQKYERWFGYPVQSINFMGGVSYAF